MAACAIMPRAATRLSRGAAAAASKAKSARSPEAAACNQQESLSTELRPSQKHAHSTTEPQLTQGCSAQHMGGRRLVELCRQQLDHIRGEELGPRHRAARKELRWAEEKQGVRVVRQREAVGEEQVEIVELAAVRDEGLLVSSQGSVVRCVWQ